MNNNYLNDTSELDRISLYENLENYYEQFFNYKQFKKENLIILEKREFFNNYINNLLNKKKITKKDNNLIFDIISFIKNSIKSSPLVKIPTYDKTVETNIKKRKGNLEDYLEKCLDLSKKKEEPILSPFNNFSILDYDGLTHYKKINKNEGLIIYGFFYNNKDLKYSSVSKIDRIRGFFLVYNFKLLNREFPLKIITKNICNVYSNVDNVKDLSEYFYKKTDNKNFYHDIVTSLILESSYITDPSNFILRVEKNKNLEQKLFRNNRKKEKTNTNNERIISERKYYLIKDFNEFSKFLKESSLDVENEKSEIINNEKETKIELVKGYVKTFYSDKFKNMKGKSIFIEPYLRIRNKNREINYDLSKLEFNLGDYKYKVINNKSLEKN